MCNTAKILEEKDPHQLLRKRKEVIKTFQNLHSSSIYEEIQIYRLVEFSNSFFNNGTIVQAHKKLLAEAINERIHNSGTTTVTNNESIVKIILNNIKEKETKVQSVEKESIPSRVVKFNEKTDKPRTSPPVIPTQRITTETNKAKFRTHQKHVGEKNISRIEFRLNMKETNDDVSLVGQLQRQIQELVNEMLGSDKSIQFLPWYNNHEQIPLPQNKVPNDLRQINRYFQRVRPKDNGFTYGEFKIRHKKMGRYRI